MSASPAGRVIAQRARANANAGMGMQPDIGLGERDPQATVRWMLEAPEADLAAYLDADHSISAQQRAIIDEARLEKFADEDELAEQAADLEAALDQDPLYETRGADAFEPRSGARMAADWLERNPEPTADIEGFGESATSLRQRMADEVARMKAEPGFTEKSPDRIALLVRSRLREIADPAPRARDVEAPERMGTGADALDPETEREISGFVDEAVQEHLDTPWQERGDRPRIHGQSTREARLGEGLTDAQLEEELRSIVEPKRSDERFPEGTPSDYTLPPEHVEKGRSASDMVEDETAFGLKIPEETGARTDLQDEHGKAIYEAGRVQDDPTLREGGDTHRTRIAAKRAGVETTPEPGPARETARLQGGLAGPGREDPRLADRLLRVVASRRKAVADLDDAIGGAEPRGVAKTTDASEWKAQRDELQASLEPLQRRLAAAKDAERRGTERRARLDRDVAQEAPTPKGRTEAFAARVDEALAKAGIRTKRAPTAKLDMTKMRGAADMLSKALLGRNPKLGLIRMVTQGKDIGLDRTRKLYERFVGDFMAAGDALPVARRNAEKALRIAAGRSAEGKALLGEKGAIRGTPHDRQVLNEVLRDVISLGQQTVPDNALLNESPIRFAMSILADVADRQRIAARQGIEDVSGVTPTAVVEEVGRTEAWRARRAELDAAWNKAKESGDRSAMARIALERARLVRPERAAEGAGLAAEVGEQAGGGQRAQAAQARRQIDPNQKAKEPEDQPLQREEVESTLYDPDPEATQKKWEEAMKVVEEMGLDEDMAREVFDPMRAALRNEFKERTALLSKDGKGWDIEKPSQWETKEEGGILRLDVKDTEELWDALNRDLRSWNQYEKWEGSVTKKWFDEPENWHPVGEEQKKYSDMLYKKFLDAAVEGGDQEAAKVLNDLNRLEALARRRHGPAILDSVAWHGYRIDQLKKLLKHEPDRIDPETGAEIKPEVKKATEAQTDKAYRDETHIRIRVFRTAGVEEANKVSERLDGFVEKSIFEGKKVPHRSEWTHSQISDYIDHLNEVRRELGISPTPRGGVGLGNAAIAGLAADGGRLRSDAPAAARD